MNTISVWRATAPEAGFPTLYLEITTDVVIVGGGITGVTLALNLAEKGTSAVLLEAHNIGFGSTGNSTGNLYETTSKGIHHIVDQWDSDTARAVATARRAAVEQIDQRVRKFDIPCAFRRCRLYRYATSGNAQDAVESTRDRSRLDCPSISKKRCPLLLRRPPGPCWRWITRRNFIRRLMFAGLRSKLQITDAVSTRTRQLSRWIKTSA